MKQAIIIETLGDIKAGGYELTAHCAQLGCGKQSTLDLDMLIERFDAGHKYVRETRISSALRCARCGGKGGVCQIAPSGVSIKQGNLDSQASDTARWLAARSQ